MEKALKVVRGLKEKKIIRDFAIGGGVAVLYYTEPILTYNLDIFFIPIEERLDVLAPIYKYLREKGYKPQVEHVQIEGVPVQFIPVYNELVREAVQNSVKANYGRIKPNLLVWSISWLSCFRLTEPKIEKDLSKYLKMQK